MKTISLPSPASDLNAWDRWVTLVWATLAQEGYSLSRADVVRVLLAVDSLQRRG